MSTTSSTPVGFRVVGVLIVVNALIRFVTATAITGLGASAGSIIVLLIGLAAVGISILQLIGGYGIIRGRLWGWYISILMMLFGVVIQGINIVLSSGPQVSALASAGLSILIVLYLWIRRGAVQPD